MIATREQLRAAKIKDIDSRLGVWTLFMGIDVKNMLTAERELYQSDDGTVLDKLLALMPKPQETPHGS